MGFASGSRCFPPPRGWSTHWLWRRTHRRVVRHRRGSSLGCAPRAGLTSWAHLMRDQRGSGRSLLLARLWSSQRSRWESVSRELVARMHFEALGWGWVAWVAWASHRIPPCQSNTDRCRPTAVAHAHNISAWATYVL